MAAIAAAVLKGPAVPRSRSSHLMRSLLRFASGPAKRRGARTELLERGATKCECTSGLMTAHNSGMNPSSHQQAGIAGIFGEHPPGELQIGLERWQVDERLHGTRAPHADLLAA